VGEVGISSAIVVGLSLITSPTRFKVVKGFIEKLTLKEISERYGIKYKYVVRLANDMCKKGLLTKAKLFINSIYVPTPQLVRGFKVACLELYHRTSKLPEKERDNYLSKYGITYNELLRLVGRKVGEGGGRYG
jgi:hypothetical protein